MVQGIVLVSVARAMMKTLAFILLVVVSLEWLLLLWNLRSGPLTVEEPNTALLTAEIVGSAGMIALGVYLLVKGTVRRARRANRGEGTDDK